MKNISKIINEFSPISLKNMDRVKLMNRTDTKFVFSYNKLPSLLNSIMPFYHILDVNNSRVQSYKSLYYDTEERDFYIKHHNRRVNRNKIRFREYVGSDLTFLEIKFKNNKGRTIKKRIKVDTIHETLNKEDNAFIQKIIGYPIDVHAKQYISFDRITLVHKIAKERLTIDINLDFYQKDNKGDFKYIVIAEVKQERMSRSSDFIRIAKEMQILPFRLSKYCMSTLQLNPAIKHNRFKKKLLFINKIKQE